MNTGNDIFYVLLFLFKSIWHLGSFWKVCSCYIGTMVYAHILSAVCISFIGVGKTG